MSPLALKEEEEREKKRREEEKKKKEQQYQDELHHKTEAKKEAIAKGEMKEMSFGEAKPIVEVSFKRVHIKGTLASEKYDPVVKESLAVKVIEDEKIKAQEKEKERIAEEIKKSDEIVRKEENLLKEVRENSAKAKDEKLKEEKRAIENIRKEKEKIAKLLEEARKAGMVEPAKYIAKELLEREIRRGVSPKIAIKTVILILQRLDLVKNKKEKKSILNFLKSLLKK